MVGTRRDADGRYRVDLGRAGHGGAAEWPGSNSSGAPPPSGLPGGGIR